MSETPLDRFRAETGTPRHLKEPKILPPVPRRQWLLVFNTLLWFALTLFWFRGGLGLWGSFVSLGLGLWTFFWLIAPVAPLRETDRPDGTPFAHLKRLFTFPFFWIGLVVLGYGVLQTLNPAYELVPVPGKGAKMEPLDFIEWLPSGVRVPLFMTNSPRAGLLQIALPWLMVCCLYVGLQSRRALDFLLNGVLAIISLWTLMALGYYYTESETIYWGIEMGVNNIPPFWGSLKNPNHGGVIQLFGMILSLALAGRRLKRAFVTSHFSGLQVFYLAVALFLSLGTLQSLSRGAILLMGLVWLVALTIAVVTAYRERSFKVVAVMATCFVLFISGASIWFVMNSRGGSEEPNSLQKTMEFTSKQIDSWQSDDPFETDDRIMLNRVCVRMFKSSPIYGYGIGGWSFFYRDHVDFFNEIGLLMAYYTRFDEEGNRLDKGVRRAVPMHYDHAHNEYLQYVCELGIVGFVPLVGMLFYVPVGILRNSGLRGLGFLSVMAFGVLFAVGVYSLIEFPLRTPALGLLVGLILASALLESSHRNRQQSESLM